MYVATPHQYMGSRQTDNRIRIGIKEGLRIRTPVPTGLPRVIAKGGNVVLGKWVPEGTCVIVNQNATFHLESNFK